MSDRPLSADRSHHPFASASRQKPPLDSAAQFDRRVGFRQQRSTRTVALNTISRGFWAASVRPGLPYLDQPGAYGVGEGFFRDNVPTGDTFRNFFTFRLPRLERDERLVGATLRLTRLVGRAGSPVERFGLFDVSTSPQALGSSSPIGVNPSIFNDLGTGRSYGAYNVSTTGNPSDLLSFRLNQTAVNNINRSQRRLFSIGGSIQSLGDAPITIAETLFTGGNSSTTVQLVLRIRRP